MPSELDTTNHSVFHADATAIKGARDTESALRYLPFVTIINTAGFGQQFDLRAQGRLSANGVKLYINGIPANPVDSYSNPMPIATVIPSLIDDILVTPGGGAVLYGSGAKGGTINIITSKRQAPYFIVGGGYVNTMATKGHSFNAFAHASENFGKDLKANAGLAYTQMGGPREDDSSMGGEFVLGADYAIALGQKISFDADIFYGKTKTTPYNSLINGDNINDSMVRYAGLTGLATPNDNYRTNVNRAEASWEAARYICLSGAASNIANCRYNLYDFEPDKDSRAEAGNGEIQTTNLRATGVLGYEAQPTKVLKFNADAFYTMSSQKYDTYKMNLPYFVLGYVNPTNPTQRGYNWFLPRPHATYTGYDTARQSHTVSRYNVAPNWSGDGQRSDWHFFDQSGSSFLESKFGLNLKANLKHESGEFTFGINSHYEMSNKKQNSHLRQAIADGFTYGGLDNWGGNYPPANTVNPNLFRTLVVDIRDKTDLSILTNSIYMLERYDFTKQFSVALGARYEMKNYKLKLKDEFSGQKLQFQAVNRNYDAPNNTTRLPEVDTDNYAVTATSYAEFSKDYKKNYDNFVFELAPVFRYSNSGSLYLRGEYGYVAPPAWAMLQRIGIVNGASKQPDIFSNELGFNFAWRETGLKSETYYTAELGWKELIGTRIVPLGFRDLTINALLFSASVFYTDSKDEFYFIGDTWSGMELGTYDKSRRMGVELAFEQYFLSGALGFNESFTYLKAEKEQNGEWSAIPYTYDYKATVGANLNASTFVEIVDISVGIWLQNSIYGNQNVYAAKMSVNTPAGGEASATNPLIFNVVQQDNVKLKPYIISDFGVSLGLNKGAVTITAGVKNVFDTFYYDYYNNDRSAVVNENRYVVGRGRTVFVEGQYKY